MGTLKHINHKSKSNRYENTSFHQNLYFIPVNPKIPWFKTKNLP